MEARSNRTTGFASGSSRSLPQGAEVAGPGVTVDEFLARNRDDGGSQDAVHRPVRGETDEFEVAGCAAFADLESHRLP